MLEEYKSDKRFEILEDKDEIAKIKKGDFTAHIEKRKGYGQHFFYSLKIFYCDNMVYNHDLRYRSKAELSALIKIFLGFKQDAPNEDTAKCPSIVEILEKQNYTVSNKYESWTGASGIIRQYLRAPCVVSYAIGKHIGYFLLKTKTKFIGVEFIHTSMRLEFLRLQLEDVLDRIETFANSQIFHKELDENFKQQIVAGLI